MKDGIDGLMQKQQGGIQKFGKKTRSEKQMVSGANFDEAWRNYCWLCEWESQCHESKPCGNFQPPDWLDLQVAEIVDDQDMRARAYLCIVAQFDGGEE